jgi:hypothetical protein
MKKLDIFFRTAIQIVLLCAMGMAMTFLSDYLSASGFFGDAPETRRSGCFQCDGIAWGARHYWYAWCSFLLCALGIVRIFMGLVPEEETAHGRPTRDDS